MWTSKGRPPKRIIGIPAARAEFLKDCKKRRGGEPKRYPCGLAAEGCCPYGGNKRFDYGFVSGTAEYCRFAKKWTKDLKKCPYDTD